MCRSLNHGNFHLSLKRVEKNVFIKEFYAAGQPVISFEIFPPKGPDALQTVEQTVTGLQRLSPAFISVTYGAAGSTRELTVEIASMIKNRFRVETLAHLTCVGHTAREIDEILDRLRAAGIENILALRGDPPAGAGDFDYSACDFRYAADLVRYIRARAGVCIGAAAYPEGHISASRLSTDLAFLKEKVDTGVDFLITQLFFDNRVFYNFLENARRIGISCPIAAGILPVLNAAQIKRIVSLCGASIPARLWLMVDKYGDSPEDLEKAGIEYASAQIEDLAVNGADGIHLFTLNRVAPAEQILKNAGLI